MWISGYVMEKIASERMRDALREAERDRLIREALAAQEPRPRLTPVRRLWAAVRHRAGRPACREWPVVRPGLSC
jgi:hypothetical protein